MTIRAGNTTTLLSPNFPTGYYPNMRCEWTIFTDQTHRISLKIENFDMEGSPTCAYDKVEVYQGNFSLSAVLHVDNSSKLLQSTRRVHRGRLHTESDNLSTGYCWK